MLPGRTNQADSFSLSGEHSIQLFSSQELAELTGWFYSIGTPASATTLLPWQDNPAPSRAMSAASGFVVSCEVILSEVGICEIRKPQVAGSIPVAGSRLRSNWPNQ